MAAQVNGDVPNATSNSAFLQHLMTLPVIHDSVVTIKENQYAQKSFQIGDSAYKTFAKPVLPYFSGPYQYVSPYVRKADSIGDQTLVKIEERFPVVKKPTGELYSEAKTLVLFPYRKSLEGKDHVFKTYSDECTRTGEAGIVTYGKAFITTAIIISNETISWFGGFLKAKQAEVKGAANN